MYKRYREIFGKIPYTEIVPDLTELKNLVVTYEPNGKTLDAQHTKYLDDFLHKLFSYQNTIYLPSAHMCVTLMESIKPSKLKKFLSVFLYEERMMFVKNITVNAENNQFLIEIDTPTAINGFGAEILHNANVVQRRMLIDDMLEELG